MNEDGFRFYDIGKENVREVKFCGLGELLVFYPNFLFNLIILIKYSLLR